MAIFKIDDDNEIYYEYVEPKDGGFTCVFVNASVSYTHLTLPTKRIV